MNKEYDITISRPNHIDKPGVILISLIIGVPTLMHVFSKRSLETMKDIVLIQDVFTGTMDEMQILSLIVSFLPIIMIVVGFGMIASIINHYLKTTKRTERVEFLIAQGWKISAPVSDVKIGVNSSSRRRYNVLIIKVSAHLGGVDGEFASEYLIVRKQKQMPDGYSTIDLDVTTNDLNLPENFDVYINPNNTAEYYVDIQPILTPR